MLTVFDYSILAILIISTLYGAFRGFVREAFALIGWIVAIVIALRYADKMAHYIPASWPGGEFTQWLLSFIAIVISVKVLAALGSAIISRLTNASGLRPVDRLLGMIFGLARGLIFIIAIFLLLKLTELPKHSLWQHSVFRPVVEESVALIKPWIEKNASQLFKK